MRSSMNPIKALANRFVSLPPPVRMKITKTLLEMYASGPSEKSFLEVFWDEVEKAHGDHLDAVNPFAEKSRETFNEMTRSCKKPEILFV